ncbi:hypothetical protein JL721_11881 [Aureococcus anophagefferens]|nr:hypothetical protein JL721_11881 [Aureococcus anophagefferens]
MWNNKSLTSLDLSRNDLSDFAGAQIGRMLPNAALRRIADKVDGARGRGPSLQNHAFQEQLRKEAAGRQAIADEQKARELEEWMDAQKDPARSHGRGGREREKRREEERAGRGRARAREEKKAKEEAKKKKGKKGKKGKKQGPSFLRLASLAFNGGRPGAGRAIRDYLVERHQWKEEYGDEPERGDGSEPGPQIT